MNTYVILRRQGWATTEDLARAGAVSARVGTEEMPDRVRWIRSYVTREPNGMVGTVCIYQATDPEAVREHARRAGLPCDLVLPVVDTVLVNADPTPASSNAANSS